MGIQPPKGRQKKHGEGLRPKKRLVVFGGQ